MGKVTLQIEDSSVATIVLDNPKKRNILSEHMIEQLEAHLQSVLSSDVKALIIRSNYSQFFSAGGDVREWYSYKKEDAYKQAYRGGKLLSDIENLPFVTIAAVSGSCLGGGCELALACDIRIATKDATFGQPEILLGNGPSWGGYYRLMRTIGYAKAKEMILLGDTYAADEAHGFGLVNRVVEDWEELLATVSEMARRAAKNYDTATVSKLIVNQLGNELLADNFVIDAHSAAYFAETEMSRFRKQAFLEKRLQQILE